MKRIVVAVVLFVLSCPAAATLYVNDDAPGDPPPNDNAISHPMTPINLEPFPNGGMINMGAYGGTIEASKSYFGKEPCQTIIAGDVNGDCEINFEDFRLLALHWCEDNTP